MENFSESVNCLECIKSSRCFKKLIPSELEFINQNKTQILYKKGENICKQGAFASYVLYISEGLVKLYLESPNNKNISIKILKTSEFIGLSSIYGDNIYNYSAIALIDSYICLIEKDSIKKLIIENGEFASGLIRGYCKNEIQLFDKIKSLGNKQMHGRIADILLYLNNDEYKEYDIFTHLSRGDIAELSGISRESIVRLLTELKNDKIIKINGKQIEILNIEKLKEISKTG